MRMFPKKNGWKNLFTPDSEIIHYGGATTKQMPKVFKLQLYGSHLIFMKLHRSWLTFIVARLLTALFFFLRVPYWLAVALLRRNERNGSIRNAETCLVGGSYCLVNWKKLLMNSETIGEGI